MLARKDHVDPNKMSFEGASPVIFAITLIYSLPVVLVNILFGQPFRIQFVPHFVPVVLGVVLLSTGIPLYFITLKQITAGFKAHRLVIEGVFSRCRNPLFGVVIFLLVPGILLLFSSWLLLTIPLVMYIAFKIFIRREEEVLEQAFGTAYINYKKTVPAIIPLLGKLFITSKT